MHKFRVDRVEYYIDLVIVTYFRKIFIIFIKNLRLSIYLRIFKRFSERWTGWMNMIIILLVRETLVTSRKLTFISFGGRYLQCVCRMKVFTSELKKIWHFYSNT